MWTIKYVYYTFKQDQKTSIRLHQNFLSDLQNYTEFSKLFQTRLPTKPLITKTFIVATQMEDLKDLYLLLRNFGDAESIDTNLEHVFDI